MTATKGRGRMRLCLYCMKQNTQKINNFCERCGKPFGDIRTPQHHLRPGTRLCGGKYIVGTAIGEGGFGITYIGCDLNLDLRVAIKEYYLSGYVSRTVSDNNTASSVVSVGKDDAEAVFRKGRDSFHDEARILARLSGQPGIVNVRDFFRENNTVYIVMEYLNGSTLKQILKSGKLFSEKEIKTLLYPVITSLTRIHEENLLHRDISPDNIMIVNNDAKLIDFGAARGYASAANRSSSIIVKPGYAPIEQYGTKREQGPWTDVYALCATIYRCITGRVPDIATDRVVSDELKTPTQLGCKVSPEFERILLKGMSVLKNDRYQSVQELMLDLYGSATQHNTPYYAPVSDAVGQQQRVTQNEPVSSHENSVSQNEPASKHGDIARSTESRTTRYDPIIKPTDGTYNAPLAVTITTDAPDAQIYFTIDGSDPSKRGKLYTKPITLGGSDAKTDIRLNAITAINGKVAGTATRNYQMISNDPFIHDIEITIPVPTAGELFTRAALKTKNAAITSVRWMDGDAPARDATFKADKIYSLFITVSPDDNYIFADDLTASIGGINAEVRANPNGTVTIVRSDIRPAVDVMTHNDISRSKKRKAAKKRKIIGIIIAVLLVCAAGAAAGIFLLNRPDDAASENSAVENTDDLSLPVLCIGGDYYEMPFKVQVMLDNGWELAESEVGSVIAENNSRHVQFIANDSTVMRLVTNDTDSEIKCEDGLMYSHVITDTSYTDISLAGIKPGSTYAELEEKLQNVEYTENNHTYTINGQNDSVIRIFMSDDGQTVDRISIDIKH